jgi:drug/metabolite transporter (DMT)-like permease
MKQNAGGLAFISFTALLLAVNTTVSAGSRGYDSPFLLGLLRWAGVAVILAAATWPTLVRNRAELAAQWKSYAVLGLLGMTINGTFPYIAGLTTSGTNIGLIASLAPLMTIVASAIALKERLGAVQLAGVALGIIGVVMIAVRGDMAALATLSLHTGDLFVVVASIGWASYSVGLKLVPTTLPPLPRLAVIAAWGTLWLVPPTLWEQFGGTPRPLDAGLLGFAVIAALIPGIAGFLSHAYTTRTAGASRAALSIYVMPVFSTLLGVVLLGEAVRPYHFAGGLTILLGVWIASRHRAVA